MRPTPTPRQFSLVVAVLPKRSPPSPAGKRGSPTKLQEEVVTSGTAVSAEELPTIQACLEAVSRGSGSQEIESGRLPRTAQTLQVPLALTLALTPTQPLSPTLTLTPTLQVPYVHVEVVRASPPASVIKEEAPLSDRIEAARVRAGEARVELDALNVGWIQKNPTPTPIPTPTPTPTPTRTSAPTPNPYPYP